MPKSFYKITIHNISSFLILPNSTTKLATKAMMMRATIHSHAAAVTPSAGDGLCCCCEEEGREEEDDEDASSGFE